MFRPLNRFNAVLSTAAFLAVVSPAAAAKAAENAAPRAPLEKVVLAYSSISGTMAPLWVTYERGFFRKHGLDVQLIFIESGSTAAQSLASKEVAFAQMAGAGVLQSRLRGSDLVMIAGFLNTMDYQLMVERGITRPEQLRGKVMAVSRFGSSSDFATRYALEKFGLVPERDVTILEIGSQPARFAALEAGRIQAAMIAVPLTLKAKALGFHTLADLQMLGLEYQHTGLATTQALLKSRPDLARNVLKAYVEGIHDYKTRREESLQVLAKYMKNFDSGLLAEVYEGVGLALTPQKPYPTLRGIEVMLHELAARDVKAKTARPEEFVNLSFVRELDSSGFIDRLYAAPPPLANTREVGAASLAVKPASSARETEKKKPVSIIPASAGAATPARPAEYIVQTGDTLSRIAVKYYGDSLNWRKIYDANKATMKNPDYIYVGQKIMLPS